MDLVELFCSVDDFVKTIKTDEVYKISQIKNDREFRGRKSRMSLSEIMTILIAYHSSNFKNFKAFYFNLSAHGRGYFPKLLSYTGFIDWVPYCLLPLCQYLKTRCKASTGIIFIDSTKIQVCKKIKGKLFGDKGYLSSKLFEELWKSGIY